MKSVLNVEIKNILFERYNKNKTFIFVVSFLCLKKIIIFLLNKNKKSI